MMDCSSVEGMESVVATVSGYHGSERFNLIKLISQSGASYVGAMSKSTTHLVCLKFEGRKYELAKKFDTVVVNHRWVEECVKLGKRVPEYPYMLESGQEMGPLVLEIPNVDKLGSLNKNGKPLSDKSNIFEGSERQIIDVDCEDSGSVARTDSFLPDDSLVLDVGKSNRKLYKSKPKKAKKSSEQENCSSSRYCFQDPPFSGLVVLEYGGSSSNSSRLEESGIESNMHSVRGRGNTVCNTGSTLAEASCKGRRLVKKNVARDNLETVLFDSDEEWHPVRHYKNNNNKSISKCTDGKRKINIFEAEGTSDVAVNNNRGSTAESLDDIEEGTHWSHLPVSERSNSCPEGALTASERADGSGSGSAAENLNAKVKDVDEFESVARLPPPADLSCVICWTEFSSTRGVLPCGHRFCYSCIQEWADHMASRRRISTCPLCKAGFSIITKLEDAATSDQKIYSQTIPCASSEVDVFVSMLQEQNRFGAEPSFGPVCCECRSREPEDLLIRCHLCETRCIHSYCLDPPLSPWICTHCKDLQMLYYHNR